MISSNLIRWSGLAALVGSVLLVILDLAEFVLFRGQPEATSAFTIVQLSFMVAIVLVFLGLVGLYARQAEQARTLGVIAFLVAFTGTVMVSGMQWSTAFLFPWLAEVAPQILDAEPSGVAVAGFTLTLVLFALGWVLFGLATLRARVLPRGAAVLLMVGAVVFLVIFLNIPGWSVVLAVALAWLGYALWSGADEPAVTTQPAT